MTARPWPRVRKARRSSCCCACGGWITTGQLIVNRGTGWSCLPCALATIRSERPATKDGPPLSNEKARS
jgi:hypothetical protein